MKAVLVALGLGLALFAGACTPATQAAIDVGLAQAEHGIKAAHDREALALKQAPCAMSVGGYVRALTAAERDAVLALCGGEQGLTFEDLANVGRAIDLITADEGRTLGDLVPPPGPPAGRRAPPGDP